MYFVVSMYQSLTAIIAPTGTLHCCIKRELF